MKNYFIIIKVNEDSYDYDVLFNFLVRHSNVNELSVLPKGIMMKIFFEYDDERREFLSIITKLDVEDIFLLEILYEEFLPGRKYLD